MQVVILAAGRGNRLRPLTDTRPKPLLEVKDKPIISRLIEELPATVDELCLVVGYLGEQIRDRFGPAIDGRPVRYIQQASLSGSADALWAAQAVIKDQPFLVVHSDDLHRREDLEKLVGFDRAFGISKVSPAPPTSVSVQVNSDENLMAFTPISPGQEAAWLCAGAYVLGKDIFTYPPTRLPNGELGLPQTILGYAQDQPVRVVRFSFWQQINTAADLARAEQV